MLERSYDATLLMNKNELNHILGAKYSDIIIFPLRAHQSSLRMQDKMLGDIIGPSVSCTNSEGQEDGLGSLAVFFTFRNWGKIPLT